jgi:hypothetical protein
MLPVFAHSAASLDGNIPGTGPVLAITNVQGEFVLSWPWPATNWVLERATDMQPSTFWGRVSPRTYQSNAVSRYVRLPGPGASGFYRLRNIGPPPPGLTGHWHLDEGEGELSDDGSNLGTLMFFTDTTWATGRIGPGALRFNGLGADDGSRAWISNAGYRVLPPSGQPFSISLWFSPEALTGQQLLVGSDADGTNRWAVMLDTPALGTNYLVIAATAGTSSMTATGRTLLLPNQWHELTVTHDGSEAKLYLDSRLLAGTSGLLLTQEGPIYFGGGVGNYNSFLGRIDDIRTYTNCLTHEEISLTGRWRFDENTGCFATDSNVKGHHAILTDATGWVPGRAGSGVELNSAQAVIRNDQYTVLPGSGGSFSISFWLRPDSLASGRSGLMSCGSGSQDGWQLTVEVNESSQTTVHLASTNCGGTLDLMAPVPLTNGVWTRLDATYNGGIATIYADGRKVQARNGAIRGSRSPVVVGIVPGTPNFHGVIDDLRIYNRERDAVEIGPVATTMWETAWINNTTNISLRGFGPPGRPLTYTVVPLITPTNGTVSHSPGSGIVTYQAAGAKGPDAFAYTVSDGEFTSAPAIVTVSVVKPHWLSPEGAGASANGSNPGQAWQAGSANALDAIWKTNNYYDCFFYAPGVYETRGWKFLTRATANPGCKHMGSGATGTNQTVIRLVDAWDPAGEGVIFGIPHLAVLCDGFEVHGMTLDCNAANNPQYLRGEPVWVRIPLATNSWVDSVRLRWWTGAVSRHRFGRAAEFRLCTREFAGGIYITNCVTHANTGDVDVVPVGHRADELLLYLDRRATDVDFYALAEVEVLGATVSLPVVTTSGGASELDVVYSIANGVDSDPGTAWASGPETHVEIALPLEPGTRISELNFHWNCTTLPEIGRLGPAASYSIRARDENTGEQHEVQFVRHDRTADGRQRNVFGTTQSPEVVITDQLTIVLTAREPMVDYYSLREVTLQYGFAPVSMRLPAAHSTLDRNRSIWLAFDQTSDTYWSCGTQGMIGSMVVTGNNMKFTRLKVIGFGTKAGRECFPMAIVPYGAYGPQNFGNILVEDCIFSDPATNNADGITTVLLVANAPDTLTNAVIRRTTVSGLREHFTYSHGFSATHMEDCLVQECGAAVYFEPDPAGASDVGPVLVRSNRFVNVESGVYVQDHPAAQFDSITCLDNEIILAGSRGWGIVACDICAPGPSGSIRNVTALNNVIRYADWLSRPANTDGGIMYTDIRHAVYANNLIALGTANALRVRQCPAGIIFPPPRTEDCEGHVSPPGEVSYPPCLDILPPGYRRAWSNNRDLSGTLLDVLFWDRGVDGKSSQQQWAE